MLIAFFVVGAAEENIRLPVHVPSSGDVQDMIEILRGTLIVSLSIQDSWGTYATPFDRGKPMYESGPSGIACISPRCWF